jgi:hypothetical protein
MVFQDYVHLTCSRLCVVDENMQQYLAHIEVKLCDVEDKLLVENY